MVFTASRGPNEPSRERVKSAFRVFLGLQSQMLKLLAVSGLRKFAPEVGEFGRLLQRAFIHPGKRLPTLTQPVIATAQRSCLGGREAERLLSLTDCSSALSRMVKKHLRSMRGDVRESVGGCCSAYLR